MFRERIDHPDNIAAGKNDDHDRKTITMDKGP